MFTGGFVDFLRNGGRFTIRHLFEHDLQKEISKANLIVLFLDYDGTLVPFKKRPEEAIPTEDLLESLKTLTQNPRCKVAIISGRSVDDIASMLNIEGLSFAGLHGIQIYFRNKVYLWEGAREAQPLMGEIKKDVIREFGEGKGIYIEDKKFTLAFHYRLLPRSQVGGAVRRFIEILKEYDSEIVEILRDLETIEVRPKGWDKGKAVHIMLRELSQGNQVLPIYIGDSLTDEDAFLCLKNQGITVFVSHDLQRETEAQFYLRNHKEVLLFLKLLAKIIS